ncbi:MAG: alpha/beta hydrolase family protein [Christensenellaceae bacterium]
MTDLSPTLKAYLFHDQTNDDGIIPYLSPLDFEGLVVEERRFANSANRNVSYFFYAYEGYRKDKLIVFLHGVGPGHKAYLREIVTLCRRGYRVLTLDYSGVGASGNDGLNSLFSPARDVLELLALLSPKEEILLIGHSLGGFTALHTLCHRRDLKKAAILSAPLSLDLFVSLQSHQKEILAYERATSPDLYGTDVTAYLQETDANILFIHSRDDALVPFDASTGRVMREIHNPHLTFRIEEHRKHNPNYTDGALAYMNATFCEYAALVANGTLDTVEKQRAFMADKSPMEMTHQDESVFDEIASLIES